MTKKISIRILKDARVRLTISRLDVIEVLLEHGGIMSVLEILQCLHLRNNQIHVTNLYSTMRGLRQAHIVTSHEGMGKYMCYSLDSRVV